MAAQQSPDLLQFRLDMITALTNMTIEVNAVKSALLAKRVLDEGTLDEYRDKERKRAHVYRDKLAQEIQIPGLP